MASISVGSVSVSVVPEVKNFASQLRKQIIPSSTKVGQEAGKALGKGITSQAGEVAASFSRKLKAELKARLADMPTAHVPVEADTAAAQVKLAAVEHQVDSLSRKTALVSVKTIGMSAALGSLTTVSGLLPAVGAGALALLPALGAAGAGFGAFGAAAIGNLDKIKPKLKALKKDFKSWSSSLSGVVVPVVTKGMGLVRQAMQLSTPLVKATGKALGGLATDMKKALSSKAAKSFITFLSNQVGPAIRGFGNIAGGALKGIGNLMRDFAPLMKPVLSGLQQLVDRFAAFTKGLGQSAGFQAFLASMKQLQPLIVDMFTNLGGLFGSLMSALAPLAGPAVKIISGLAKTLSSVFKAVGPSLTQLGKVLAAVLVPVFKALGGVLKAVIPPLVDALAPVLKALGPVIVLVAKVVARLVKAFAPFLPILGRVVGIVIKALMRAFKPLIKPLIQIGRTVATILVTALKALAPVFVVAGKAAAKILQAAMPLVPVILRLAKAFLPLLPPIARLATQLINLLVPIITPLIRLLAKLATAIIVKLVIPAVKFLVKWIAKIIGWIADFIGWVAKLIKHWRKTWNAIKRVFRRVWRWLKNTFASMKKWVTRTWHKLWNAVKRFFGNIWDGIKSVLRRAWRWMKSIFNTIKRWITRTWNKLWGGVKKTAKAVWDKISNALHSFWDATKKAFHKGVDAIKRIWNGIKRVAKKPVNFVIGTVYNQGIRDLFNTVAKKVGLELRLPKIPKLEAGGVAGTYSSPTAIVGEGNPRYPEYVIPTDPKYRDRALGLWRQAGTQMLAGGGVLGSIWNGIKGVGSSIKNAVLGFARHTFDKLLSPVNKLISKVAGGSAFGKLIAAVPKKLIGGMLSWFGDKDKTAAGFGHAVAASGPNVAIVRRTAAQFGWSKGAQWAALVKLIMSESGFRNTAQNPTSSAYGIFQFLDSTWGTVGGHKTSNPALQSLYGLRYVKQRYGNPIRAWGFKASHNWYDKGLLGPALQPGWNLAYNGTGKPEPTILPSQLEALTQGANAHGRAALVDTVNLNAYGGDWQEGFDELEHRLRHIRQGGVYADYADSTS